MLFRSHTNTPQAQDQNTPGNLIRVNQITKQLKLNYLTYWETESNSQSKLQSYLALKRQYSAADYLTTLTDPKLRSTLTKYRLSQHRLAIETGRHRKSWLPKEERLCQQCQQNRPETELHFLTECTKFTQIRTEFFSKITKTRPVFENLPPQRSCRTF